MDSSPKLPAESVALLDQAREEISHALRSGSASDPRLVEALASRLASIRVDIPEQLRLMLDAVRFFYLSGHAFTGLPIAQQARSLASESANQAATFDSLLLVGVCAADTGGLPTAMEAYADARRLAQAAGDPFREGRVWQNLGVALMYAGLYSEAINCFECGIAKAEHEPRLAAATGRSYSNIALCLPNLDESLYGLVAIEKAVELSVDADTAESSLNRVILENNFTRLLLEANNFEAAKEHAKLARLYANKSKLPRADISAAVAEGLAEVFSGQLDVGITRLTKMLDRAKALKNNTREVLMALVKSFEFAGKPDLALIYLRQLLEQQSATQKQNVLQHVKLDLEKLHPAIEDETNAIRRLTTRQEVLEGRIGFYPTYGNTLMGLAASVPLLPEDKFSITYYAPQPRAVLRVVNPKQTHQVVAHDEWGRVELTTLTKEFFMPRFLERDEALRRAPRAPYAWDGVAEVRPFGAMEKNIVEGVY